MRLHAGWSAFGMGFWILTATATRKTAAAICSHVAQRSGETHPLRKLFSSHPSHPTLAPGHHRNNSWKWLQFKGYWFTLWWSGGGVWKPLRSFEAVRLCEACEATCLLTFWMFYPSLRALAGLFYWGWGKCTNYNKAVYCFTWAVSCWLTLNQMEHV